MIEAKIANNCDSCQCLEIFASFHYHEVAQAELNLSLQLRGACMLNKRLSERKSQSIEAYMQCPKGVGERLAMKDFFNTRFYGVDDICQQSTHGLDFCITLQRPKRGGQTMSRNSPTHSIYQDRFTATHPLLALMNVDPNPPRSPPPAPPSPAPAPQPQQPPADIPPLVPAPPEAPPPFPHPHPVPTPQYPDPGPPEITSRV